jgi:hypothetical protein
MAKSVFTSLVGREPRRMSNQFQVQDNTLDWNGTDSNRRLAYSTSGLEKGTYGDYLRVLEFYSDILDEQAREIIIRWVENEDLLT